ncbi:alpha/beta fold hydrolase [Duganella sp. CY15W]|uniref:alpha/beta hydrolase family protein n=1 Tax=Duganella sp. CY15W TaxID=2692172 RepID=UPI00137123E5|nr:alpha/beta hydrolase [Duganella sp. CY15W]MYM32139.1 alpha/beta fold hydrolase [Duganella sp. CY15W]
MEQFDIPVVDQGALGATLWQAQQARAVVLLHPATAVTQSYYHAFAAYLSGLGLHVLTYDYRGTGRSIAGHVRDCKVTMADWMEQDVGAVTQWAAARFPALPLLAVGHSVGGHAIALSSATPQLRAAVIVAAHAGVTRTVRGAIERARVWTVMRVLAPLLCRVCGYMPGSRLGLGEDLPSSVMLQWSGWTRLPRYFYDDPAMDAAARAARVQLPLLVLGFDDDPWANRRAIDLLMRPLVNAQVERRQFAPSEVGLPAIGHMGFFRKRSGAALWPQVGDWLLRSA